MHTAHAARPFSSLGEILLLIPSLTERFFFSLYNVFFIWVGGTPIILNRITVTGYTLVYGKATFGK